MQHITKVDARAARDPQACMQVCMHTLYSIGMSSTTPAAWRVGGGARENTARAQHLPSCAQQSPQTTARQGRRHARLVKAGAVYWFNGTAHGDATESATSPLLQEAVPLTEADPNCWHVCWCTTENAPRPRCCPLGNNVTLLLLWLRRGHDNLLRWGHDNWLTTITLLCYCCHCAQDITTYCAEDITTSAQEWRNRTLAVHERSNCPLFSIARKSFVNYWDYSVQMF